MGLEILIEFALRVLLGLSLAMALVPADQVPAGYFRVHCYVLLGIAVLLGMVAWGFPDLLFWPWALVLSVLSYVASAVWLYEIAGAGRKLLAAISVFSLFTLMQIPGNSSMSFTTTEAWLAAAAHVTGGLLLGSTLAAMFLGHWYLNSPGMNLRPLKRLVLLMAFAVVARSVTAAGETWPNLSVGIQVGFFDALLLAVRWGAGLLGTAGVAFFVWRILRIPNTQSATGVLYVGVIFTFLGELAGSVLAA